MRSIWISGFLAGLLFVLPAGAQDKNTATAGESSSSFFAVAPDAGDAGPAAQDTTPPATPPATDQTAAAAAPAGPPTWSLGPIDFSGTVDGYYGFNFNHPHPEFASAGVGNANESNFLYNFDGPTNQFSLNFIKLGMSHSPDPVGFEFDIGYGDTMNFIGAASGPNGGSEFDKIVEQAFVSWKPMKAKGLEIDFGKFNTFAGAEVIESYSNWSYSRSLLFSYAIPYNHFGVRASIPWGKHWVVGGQVVNGWNNDTAFNTGATIGGNATVTYTKWNWVVDTYDGPANAGTNKGWRDLIDTTFNWTPNAKLAAYVNYDYDWYRIDSPVDGDNHGLAFSENQLVSWQGIAGAIHYSPNKWSFTARYEWFDDPSGFAMLGASLGAFNSGCTTCDGTGFNVSPVSQQVQEITGTVEYKFLEGLLFRGEYRYDWSNQPFFLTGFEPPDPGGDPYGCGPSACPAEWGLGDSKHQQTLTFAVIAFFGPKR